MKKLAMLISFAFIAATAQETMFGFRLGLSLNSISASPVAQSSGVSNYKITIDEESLVGFQFGFLVDWNIVSVLYFQPGIMFASKGGVISINYGNGKDDVTYKPYYLEVPFMLALKAPISDAVSFAISSGYYLSLGMFGKVKTTEDAYEYPQEDIFSKNQLKRFDQGIAFGCGLDFGSIYIGLNYDLGFAKLLQNNHSNNSYYKKGYNQSLSLVLDNKF